MHADPLLIADVQTIALIMDGRTLIPAALNAMTKGEEAAVPVELESASLVYGLFVVSLSEQCPNLA
jgi:hypothetical protein